MTVANLGALTINIEGNDAQLRALLAKYQSGQTIKVGVNASGLGATDAAIKGLTANMQALTNAITAAGTAQSRSFAPSRDTGLQAAARGVKILSDEYKQGGLSAAEYAQRSTQLRTTLELLGQTAQPLSRQMATVQSALAKLSSGEGLGGKASPIADRFRLESAAAKQATESMNVYRLAWQRKDATDAETINNMKLLEKGILAQTAAYRQEAAALEAKGVLDKAETARLAELTTLQNRLGQALRTSASVQAEVNGEFLKGSLGMNVQRGVVSALQQTTAETERLQNAERAGLITKNELKVGLEGQATAQKTALTAMQAEAAALKELGVLDLQQTERLALLTREQNGYTAALASTVGAQERSAAAQRAAIAGGLGIKGGGGLNNAAMAASFISPELGGVAMAATMGPWVAGAAALGLLGAGFASAAEKGATFQRSLTQIGAISGQSTEQMNQFGAYIQHLSTELPITTQKLAEMGREAVMVGLHGPQGMKTYTETMAAFAIITRNANGELGHTAEVGQEVVKILRSTGASTEEVNAGFGRMINGLVGLKTESGVAIPQVTALLKFWSSQGHAVGLTIEQMTGLSAALIQTGARAQGAGGALAIFFKKAEDGAASGGPKLQAWADTMHLSTDETLKLLKTDPMGFLTRFVSSAEAADRAGHPLSLTLESVGLKSQQVQRTMTELNNALPLVTGNIRIMTQASNDQGLALRTAMAATNDYKDRLTLIGNAWDAIKQNMGIAVLPGMTAVAAWALDFSKSLMNASSALDNILKATGAMPGKAGTPDGTMPVNKTTVNLDGLTPAQTTQANALMSKITALVAQQSGAQQLAGSLSGIPWVGGYLKMLAQGGVDTTQGDIGKLSKELNDLLTQAKAHPFIGPLNNQQQYLAGRQPRGFTPDKAAIIADAAKKLGVNPNDLAQVIAAETGGTFDPATKNDLGGGKSSGATGLIQFMPANARELGTSTDELQHMTFQQQMEYVVKYFENRPDFKRGGDLAMLYGAVAGSGYKRGSAAYAMNAKWDANGDGVIDKGEAVKSGWFKSFAANYFKDAGTPVKASLKTPPAAGPDFTVEAQHLYNQQLEATAAHNVVWLAKINAEITVFKKHHAAEWAAVVTVAKASSRDTAAAHKAAVKEMKDMGLSDADWAKYQKRATELAQLQSDIADGKVTGNAALAGGRSIASFNSDPVKAKALQFADSQLTVQRRAAETGQKVADQEAADRQKAADKAKADSIKLNDFLNQKKVTDAQTVLQDMKDAQQQEIDGADTAAQKLAIVKRTSAQIYKDEVAVAAAIRDKALKDAENADTPALVQAKKDDAVAVFKRAQSVAQTAQDKALNAAAKAQGAEADKAKADHDKAVKDQAKARQDVVQSLREQDIAGATQHLAHLKQLRDAEVQDAGDNVMKVLAIQKRYASDLETSAEAIVRAQYRVDVAAAKNGDLHLKAGRLQVAESKLSQGLAEAQGSDTVSTASDKVTSAIQKQRDAYHQLADSVRQSIQQGTFDDAQRQAALVSFNELGRASAKLGLTHEHNTELSRQSTYALIQEATGVDKATAAYEAYWKALDARQNNEGQADAGMRGSFGVGQDGLQAALVGSGANRKLLGDPQAALADLEIFNKAAADRIRRVYSDELATFQAYHDSVNAGVLETTTAAYARIRQGMADDQAAAEQARTTVGSLTKMLQGVLANGLDPSTSGYVQLLDELIAKGGDAGAAAQQIKDNFQQLLFLNGGTDPASVAQRLALNATLQAAKSGAFPDGGRGTDRTTNNDHVDTPYDAHGTQQAITSAQYQAESTALDSQHNRNLIREKDYLEQRRGLDERAALQGFLDADHAGENHAVILAKYTSEMLAIQARYNDATYTLDQKERDASLAAANQHASSMLALERSSAAARLQFQHGQGTISDRAFIAAEQQQAEQAALDKYLAAFNTAGSDMVLAWAQYQADLTAASEKGTTDRQALMQAELSKWAGYAGQVGGIFKKFSGGGDSVGSIAMDYIGINLNAAGKALKGDIVGATLDWLNGLGDVAEKLFGINGQVQAQKKAWSELAAAEQAAMGSRSYGGNSILNPFYDRLQKDSAALTSKVNAGFWQRLGWSIFGGAPKTLKDSEARALTQAGTVFNDFASSLYGALESALMNAFDSGNFDGVAAAVEKSLNDLVAKMYLQTLIAKSSIAADLKTLADDQSAGRDISADVARLKGDASSITQQFQQGASALPGFGAGAASGTGSGAGGSSFGAAPAAVEFSLPPMVFQGFQSFDASAVMFSGSVTTFDAAIRRMEAAFDRGMGLNINLAQGATQLQGSTTAAFR